MFISTEMATQSYIIKQPEHQVVLPVDVFSNGKTHRFNEIKKWCEDRLGERWSAFGNKAGIWDVYWDGELGHVCYRWCFSNPEDAAAFKLRWE